MGGPAFVTRQRIAFCTHHAKLLPVQGGYATSVFLFGVYGRGPWPQLTGCCPRGGGSVGGAGSMGGAGGGPLDVSTYDRAIQMAHMGDKSEEDIRLAELSALVEMGLGRKLDPEKFDQLARIQGALRQHQSILERQLENSAITGEDYLDELAQAVRTANGQSKQLLGIDTFKLIFGDAAEETDHLVEREIFLRQ